MKSLITLIMLLSSTYSFAFQMGAQCHFSPAYGECQVVNNTNRPIACHLNIFGQTAMGYTFSGFENAFLYPGQYAYAYVYANNPSFDPLVIVRGNANCDYR